MTGSLVVCRNPRTTHRARDTPTLRNGHGAAAICRRLGPFAPCIVTVVACAIPRAAAADGAPAGDAFFSEKVEPILRTHCYECHSHTGRINGGLVLDSDTLPKS